MPRSSQSRHVGICFHIDREGAQLEEQLSLEIPGIDEVTGIGVRGRSRKQEWDPSLPVKLQVSWGPQPMSMQR